MSNEDATELVEGIPVVVTRGGVGEAAVVGTRGMEVKEITASLPVSSLGRRLNSLLPSLGTTGARSRPISIPAWESNLTSVGGFTIVDSSGLLSQSKLLLLTVVAVVEPPNGSSFSSSSSSESIHEVGVSSLATPDN